MAGASAGFSVSGNRYVLGELVGKIAFDLPSGEKKKLDAVTKQARPLGRMFKKFALGGAALFAATTAIALLLGKSQVFSTFVDTLLTIVGTLSDLLFMTLWPALQPFIEQLTEFVQFLGSHEGGVMGALADPEFWRVHGTQLAASFLAAILNAGAVLLDIGANILNGLAAAIRGEGAETFGPAGQAIGEAFMNFARASYEFIVAFANFFKSVWEHPAVQSAMKALFDFAATVFLAFLGDFNSIRKLAQIFTDVMLQVPWGEIGAAIGGAAAAYIRDAIVGGLNQGFSPDSGGGGNDYNVQIGPPPSETTTGQYTPGG